MGFADLHIHTLHSYDGTSSVSAVLKHVADHTHLDIIAITDHDSISGVREALTLAPVYGVQVIPGCEITTAEGHLIALFINRPIPPGLSLVQTALKIGEQGGICIAAHPAARGTSSLQFSTIQTALSHSGVAKALVGIEAFNGGLVFTRRNPLVEVKAATLPLAQIGSSDAHILQMIGQGATEFDGKTIEDLRAAIVRGQTRVRKGAGLAGIGIISRYVGRFLLRRMGWVTHNAHPAAPLTYARLTRAIVPDPVSPVRAFGTEW